MAKPWLPIINKLMHSLKKIGSSAFKNCTSLENIYIPDSVTDIELDAFSGCTSLKRVSIPKNAKIDYYDFDSNTVIERRAW